jgi:hypothetical protein
MTNIYFYFKQQDPLQSLMFQMKGQYEYATIKMLAAHTKTLYVGAMTSGDRYH